MRGTTFMRFGRTAGLASAAVAASLLVPLSSTAASAETPVERLWTVTDGDEDGGYGLTSTDVPGVASTPREESETVEVSDVSASADGTRLVYVRDTPTAQEIVVRDTGTRVVRVVARVTNTDSVFLSGPALSPDGNLVAWTQVTLSNTGFSLKTMKSSIVGAPALAVLGYGVMAFADSTTLLVQNLAGANRLLTSGGGLTPVTGLPSDAQQVALSPDGTRIAWVEDTSTGPDLTKTSLQVGTFSLGTATVTPTNTLANTLANEQPAFSRDGATVYWSQYDGDAGLGSILSRLYDASAPAATVLTGDDHLDVAVTTLPSADTTDPATPTTRPASLLGSQAELRWNLTPTSELSGVEITRAGGTPVFVPAPLTRAVVSGLTRGQDYIFTFTAYDRSGRSSSSALRQLTALQAVPAQFADPISNTSTTPRFRVVYGASGPTSATWLVDQLASGTTTWKPWITGLHAAGSRVFGSGAAPGVNATTSVPGRSYSFRTRVVDGYGNATPYVNVTRRAVVPYDQTSMLLSGGISRAASYAYMGSYRRLSQPAHRASVTFTGNRIQLVGIKCPSCGKFRVFDNGNYVGTFDSYSTTKKVRTVLYTRYVTGKHTITIRPVGTTGRPYVFLDGVAIRR